MDPGGQPGRSDPAANVLFSLDPDSSASPQSPTLCVSLLTGFRAASPPLVTSPLPYPTPQENPSSLLRTSTLGRTLQGPVVHQLGTLGICGNVFTDGPPSIHHPVFIL